MSTGQPLSREEADGQVEAAFSRHKQGDLEFAARVYQQVLAVHPQHAAALHYLGLVAQQTGHSKEAKALLERSIEFNPRDARAHNHLGQVHVVLKNRPAATACFKRALEVDPDHVDSLNNLANTLKVRDLFQAIELYRRALQLNPGSVLANYNLAIALKDDSRFDEAVALLRRVIELDPRHSRARYSLAMLLEQQGRFEEAIEHYLEARRLDPGHVASLANLIAIRSYEPDEPMVRDAEEMLNSAQVSEEERIKLHHGLGKYYDRVGRHEQAFRHFAASKAIVKQQAPDFDVAGVAKNFDRSIGTFTREVLARLSAHGNPSQRPVFIVGMPRSGTTLAEQILASHPLVFGAGELTEMPQIVKFLRPDYPECVPGMDAAALAGLAERYLAASSKHAPAHAQRITDKMPLNFTFLGMVATLFPHAHIVHCRRDPRDVGLSCFSELLALEHGYGADLEIFGRYFLQHERLMAHWRAVLPMPIHELRYEEMVAAPEASSRALVAHCGLEWDPACLRFQDTERTVRTPSRWQVRQPIYRSSVGRWRNYAEQLAPLIRVLEEAGYEYGR